MRLNAMRPFHLWRHEDVHGKSGTGIVAEGIEFTNGKCCVSWLTATSSIGVYDNIREVEEIHGHEGRTEIIWDDEVEEVGKEVLSEGE